MLRPASLVVLCWLGIVVAAACGSRAPARGEAAGAAVSEPAPVTAPAGREVAILAGGCFWGMEDLLREVDGVTATEVGYIGGDAATASYDQVHLGTTGHAEAVRVEFDPARISYAELLERWYFRMHDPTTKDRQGNDVGGQYRSTIFYTSDAQRAVAEEVRARVDASGKWKAPVVTTIEPAGVWTRAEDWHQDYLEANPDGYTCHFLRD